MKDRSRLPTLNEFLPDSLNVPRREMPQIRGEHFEDFLDYLRDVGVSVTYESAPAYTLRPTQSEFRQERVDAIPESGLDKPVLVSSDNYVLDGTHRWVKHWQRDQSADVPVIRLDRGVAEALCLMREFPQAEFVANTSRTPRNAQPKSKGKKNYDPTRTLSIRQALVGRIRKRFAILKGRIFKLLVTDDAFGLKTPLRSVQEILTANERLILVNVFCPTGEGGGVDPSCSPDGSSGDTEAPSTPVKYPPGFKVDHPDNKPNEHASNATRPELTTVQARALREYSDLNTYRPLNEALRAGTGLPSAGALARLAGKKDLAGTHAALQQAFDRAPAADRPFTVKRGLTVDGATAQTMAEKFEQAAAGGNPVRLKGYQSTSAVPSVGDPFTEEGGGYRGNVKLTIHAVHGLDAKPYSKFPTENEVILNHDSEYTVGRVERRNGSLHVELFQKPPVRKATTNAGRKEGSGARGQVRGGRAGGPESAPLPGRVARQGHLPGRIGRDGPSVRTGLEGLEEVINAFCPTGDGGGQDNSCPPSSIGMIGRAKGVSDAVMAKVSAAIDKVPGGKKLREKAQKIKQKIIDRYGAKQAAAIFASGQAISWAAFGVGGAIGHPVWIPSAVAMTPALAIAEINYQLRDRKGETRNEGYPTLSEADIGKLAHEVIEELRGEWQAVRNTFDPSQPRDDDGKWLPTKSTPEAGWEMGHPYSIKAMEETDTVASLIPPGLHAGYRNQLEGLAAEARMYAASAVLLSKDKESTNYAMGEHVDAIKKLQEISQFLKFFARPPQPETERGPFIQARKGITLIIGRHKEAIKQLSMTVNAGEWAPKSSPEQIAEFQQWLDTQLQQLVIGKTEEELWAEYARQGFLRGAGRAWQDTNAGYYAAKVEEDGSFDFMRGGKDAFMRSAFGRPESVEKIKLLAGRSFDELENVTSDMSTKISRTLTDGLVRGMNPRDIADEMDDVVDIGLKRADVIARTEIIRAHAEGQLDAFERLGVDELGVEVEWSTAGDERVCVECSSMEGKVFSVEDARGMIPLHPQCRCAFIPVVPEDLLTRNVFSGRRARPVLNANDFFATCDRDPQGHCLPGTGGGGDGGAPKGAASSVPYHLANAYETGQYTVVKSLGGSTGAKLIQLPNGEQYVMKTGGSPDHLRSEHEADKIYAAMGVKTPESHLLETKDGPVKFAKFMEGQEYGKFGPHDQAAIAKDASAHFVHDALMGNWDVAGMGGDNLLYHPASGETYRIDNGGALAYRAQGTPKGDKWGPEVKELESMRDPSVNPQSAALFKGVTHGQIQQQIKDVLSKKDAILAAASPANKAVLEKRLEYLQDKIDNPPSLVSSGHDLKTGAGLMAHIQEKAAEHGETFTAVQLKKLEALNPNGIENGEFKSHYFGNKLTNSAKQDWLKKVLPPGTALKMQYHYTKEKAGIISAVSDVGGKGLGTDIPDTPAPSVKMPKAPKTPKEPDSAPLSPAGPGPLPKTYAGLQPGHKYVNSAGATKEVESVTPDGPNVKVKFKGESGHAVIPGDKAFKFKEPIATPTSTPPSPTAPSTSPVGPDMAPWTGEAPVSGSQSHTYVNEHQKPVIESLTKGERGSVVSYTGSMYATLNKAMRACPPDFECLKGKDKAHADNILAAIDKSPPFAQPVLVRRGMHLTGKSETDFVGVMKAAMTKGEHMQFPSVTSTSVKSGFSGNVRFEISAKRGLGVESVSHVPHEAEVLLSPKQKFKVIDVQQGTSKHGSSYHVVRLEEI